MAAAPITIASIPCLASRSAICSVVSSRSDERGIPITYGGAWNQRGNAFLQADCQPNAILHRQPFHPLPLKFLRAIDAPAGQGMRIEWGRASHGRSHRKGPTKSYQGTPRESNAIHPACVITKAGEQAVSPIRRQRVSRRVGGSSTNCEKCTKKFTSTGVVRCSRSHNSAPDKSGR
jgi:hypothetical protein